jgi:F0F1-type ATP synthase assembly protein I
MPNPSQDGQIVKQAKAWTLATNFAFGVIGLALIGWALEKWVWPSASPWLILGGLILGLVSGTVRFVIEANRMNRADTPRTPVAKPSKDNK